MKNSICINTKHHIVLGKMSNTTELLVFMLTGRKILEDLQTSTFISLMTVKIYLFSKIQRNGVALLVSSVNMHTQCMNDCTTH
jgi:hypothetical protein